MDQTAGQRVIDSGIFKPGDMIVYFNIDPHGDYGGAKQYAHSGMFAGKRGGDTEGKITCHTICRFRPFLGGRPVVAEDAGSLRLHSGPYCRR